VKWSSRKTSPGLAGAFGRAGYLPNVTNFSKGKTIEGKTIKKFSNCLSLF
jgi:hypothetical protein